MINISDIELFEDERLDEVNENLTLIQKKDGLTFGTDAFLLASFIKNAPSAKGAELGAGTGIVSLLAAQRQKLGHIYAIEVQSDFCALTDRNVKLNGLGDKITVLEADARDIKATSVGGELDVVFSNPPYMKTDSGKRNTSERKYIARHEVKGGIDDFCAAAYRLLKHGGKFYCVYRPDRLVGLLSAMRNHRLEPKILQTVCANTESAPSMVLVMAQKGGNEGLITPPTLFLNRDGSTELTERAARIYDTLSFE